MQGREILFDRRDIPADLLEFFEPADCGGCYLCHMVEVFREVRRVLRGDGTCWLNIGDSYAGSFGAQSKREAEGIQAINLDRFGAGKSLTRKASSLGFALKPKDLMLIPARLAIRLQEDGWWVRSDIAWCKRAPMPESCNDRPMSAWEHVFLLTKSAKYFYDAEAVKEEADGDTHSRGSKRSPPIERAGIGHERWCETMTRDEEIKASGKRNLRNFWLLGPAPFPEAHFATFPPRIPEIAILAGTSAKGVCPKCAAPWARVTERRDTGKRQKMADGWDTGAGGHGTIHRAGREKGDRGIPVMETETIGWRASCSCATGPPMPATVLDPFAGSFTTSLVAERLQRDSIGIELNPAYVDLGRRRLAADSSLFCSIEGQSNGASQIPGDAPGDAAPASEAEGCRDRRAAHSGCDDAQASLW